MAPPIDEEALAAKFGAVSAPPAKVRPAAKAAPVDEDALAAQFGGADIAGSSNVGQPDAPPPPPPPAKKKLLGDISVDQLSQVTPEQRAGHSLPYNMAQDFGASTVGATAGVVRHPSVLAKSFLPDGSLVDMASGSLGPIGPAVIHGVEGAYHTLRDNPLSVGIPQLLGQMVGGEITGEAGGVIGRGASRLVNGANDVVRTGMQKMTNTTPNATGEFVAKTARDNEAAIADAAQKNASAQAKYNDAQQKLNDAGLQDQAGTADAQQKLAADKSAWAQKEFLVRQARRQADAVTAQKQVIATTKDLYAKVAIDNLQKTKAAVNESLNGRWNDLRAKMEAPGTPPSPVASQPIIDAIDKARNEYLVGSPDNLKRFNDLVGRIQPEELNKGLEEGQPPVSRDLGWQEARTHYSNIASEMYSADLPGNVYKALKEVRNALDQQLGAAAQSRGLGGEYGSVKNDWSQYKDDFDNMGNMSTANGSPLARAVRFNNATDMGNILTGKFAPDLLQRLAKYRESGANPQVLVRYRQLSDQASGLKAPKIPASPVRVTRTVDSTQSAPAQPALPPPPVLNPDVTTVTPEMVQQMKSDNVLKRADRIRNLSNTLANTGLGIAVPTLLMEGHPLSAVAAVAARIAYSMGKEGFAKYLENPNTVDSLANLTPGDMQQIMRLPADQRAGFTQLIQAAQARGVPIPGHVFGALGIPVAAGKAGGMDTGAMRALQAIRAKYARP